MGQSLLRTGVAATHANLFLSASVRSWQLLRMQTEWTVTLCVNVA